MDPCAPFRDAFSKLIEEHLRLAISDGSIATLSGAGGGPEDGAAAAIKKMAPEASSMAAELVRIALVEALMRAKKHAEARADPHAPIIITAQDVSAVLPQFLLDFC